MQSVNRRGEGFTISNITKIANIVVSKFVNNGSIGFQTFDDVKQNILSKYLEKQEKIESAFTGSSKVETYLSAVFYRMTLEYIRSTKSYSQKYCEFYDNFDDANSDSALTPEMKMIVESERKYFSRVLTTLGKDAIRIKLYCKVYFRLKINKTEAVRLFGEQYADWALEVLNGDFKNDGDVYNALCEVNNKVNNKELKPDSVRMFINSSLNRVINRMNHGNRAMYDKESMGILFEVMCNRVSKQKSHNIELVILLLLLTGV